MVDDDIYIFGGVNLKLETSQELYRIKMISENDQLYDFSSKELPHKDSASKIS